MAKRIIRGKTFYTTKAEAEAARRKGDRRMLRICKIAIERCRFIRKKIRPKKEEIPLKISQIKGEVAFKGTAEGKAKVIFDQSELTKLEKGEILVAQMTTPEFILAIERAKAIVTDDGGIGCHAAIISREFKIPCIIGTKIATKVLKDGDLIEVDVEKGVVKILQKAK